MSNPESPLDSTVHALAGWLASKGAPPGDRAALRRYEPGTTPSTTFYRVMAGRADEVLQRLAPNEEPAWALVLAILADAAEADAPSVPLGRGLAEADYSEGRLARLLQADERAVADEARAAARYLTVKGKSGDLAELARLVLPSRDGGAALSSLESTRRAIARSYYRTLSSKDR